ncbi:eIF1-like protein [Backusella circina FSU 941]|nr:eIF1-like protein [Backusella circina FSU 941]
MANEPRKVFLCGICTMPLEYCEFSGTQEKCKEWLNAEDEDLYEKIYGADGVTEGVSNASRVTIKRIERTKRKSVTTVFGLDVFAVDMKKAAKMFANKFACGASVAKNNQGLDEIVVQGDFSDEIHDLILQNWPAVPEENIDKVEEKKKKKGQE